MGDYFNGKHVVAKAEDVADAVHYVLSTQEHVQVSWSQLEPSGENIQFLL